jgi:hypothetical protein
MKLNLIRRICMLAALSAVAVTGAAVSADPLPVPEAPRTAVKGPLVAVPVTTLASPADGGTLDQTEHMAWQNIGADSYVVKMRVLQTGQRIKKTVTPDACNAVYCIYTPSKADFYSLVKDGQTVKWKVTAKFIEGGVTYRSTSNARTFTVDEINAPVLLEGVTSTELRWEVDSNTVKWHILFIKNTKNGIVKKVVFDANGGCSNPCVYYPELLEQDTKYKWWVKAKGFTGENALSAKQTFLIPSKS